MGGRAAVYRSSFSRHPAPCTVLRTDNAPARRRLVLAKVELRIHVLRSVGKIATAAGAGIAGKGQPAARANHLGEVGPRGPLLARSDTPALVSTTIAAPFCPAGLALSLGPVPPLWSSCSERQLELAGAARTRAVQRATASTPLRAGPRLRRCRESPRPRR